MGIEVTLLAASVAFGIVQIVVVSHLQSWQRGYSWTASSREQTVPPLTGVAGRMQRALQRRFRSSLPQSLPLPRPTPIAG